MKELVLGIREAIKHLQGITQTRHPLFGGETPSHEICKWLFISLRTLLDYRDKGIFPTPKLQGFIV